ncbi:MAG: cytochrome c [Steroidobacteraceae bacterium]
MSRIPVAVALLVAAGAASAAQAAPPSDGKALFTARCGMCHQTIGMAVAILSRRPGDASKGLLEERTDLSAAFIRTVVRTGIINMPRIARGEVSDPELAQIASYLSRGRP